MRSLDDIVADIISLERESEGLLADILATHRTGSSDGNTIYSGYWEQNAHDNGGRHSWKPNDSPTVRTNPPGIPWLAPIPTHWETNESQTVMSDKMPKGPPQHNDKAGRFQ